MIYLYCYLGVGIVALIITMGALTKNGAWASFRKDLNAVNPDRRRISNRVIFDVAAPVLGAFLATVTIVVFWPVALYTRMRHGFSPRSEVVAKPYRNFAVEPHHLLERLSEEEIGSREVVTDPLGGVPPMPFGHLHSAWRTFLEGRSYRDEIWSFAALWQRAWNHTELRTGYALVRRGIPGTFFVTMRKEMPNEAASDRPSSSGQARLAD